MAVTEALFNSIKNYLDMTWNNDADDEKLVGIIARGMKYLDNVTGRFNDYNIAGKPQELLYEYCRYVRSNALQDFQNNYLHELLSFQITNLPQTNQEDR